MAETSQIINIPRDTTMQAGNTQLAAIVTKLQAICDALGLSSPLIADDFDPAVSYSPGDYCIKAGTLYRCTTATTADAPWDVTEWTATSVTQEFIRLQAILGDEDISAIGDGTVTGAITTLNSTLAGLGNLSYQTGTGTLNTTYCTESSLTYYTFGKVCCIEIGIHAKNLSAFTETVIGTNFPRSLSTGFCVGEIHSNDDASCIKPYVTVSGELGFSLRGKAFPSSTTLTGSVMYITA